MLIHGFTGTPKEMRWMGEFLARQGYSVLGVRLSGHATCPEDMIRSRWSDWTASVEDGYQLLRGITDRIFLVGLSMGGVLSLLMSAHLEVAGVVAMSTPYQLPASYPAWLFRMLSIVMPFRAKSKEPPGSDWFDKPAHAEHVAYRHNPVRAVAELQLLLAEMRTALPLVGAPVLLIHSKDDQYVLPENMERLYAGLVKAPDKKMLWITGSGHVLTRDAARGQVFDAALKFIHHVEHKA